MDDIKDVVLFGGLLVNFLGVLFAVFSSRIKIERRLTTVETYCKILLRNHGIQTRSGDNISGSEIDALK